MKHLLANGFTDQHLDDAGLVVRTDEGKVYDRFRGRLMFPIRDDAGRVVGFSARVITATSDAPKYINSPQTIVYDKSRVLYGLDLAKRAIMQARSAYVVEGQADVIAMHQAGFTATVASSGTALTPEQLRSLTRYADRVVLVFDADAAGQKAMSRGIETALQAGLDVQCVVLPEGEDPDSMIQQHGTEAMQELLDAALPWMTYQMERFRLMGDLEDAVRKAQAVRTMLGWIGGIPDELRRPFLIQELATSFELDASLLTPIVPTPIVPTTAQPTRHTVVQRQTQPAALQPQVLQLLHSELELLRIALAVDHGLALMVNQFDMTAESFATARGQSLFHHILLAEHETHSIIDYIQAHPTLPQQDKDLLQSISSSVVVLSTKWKEFDVDLPTHNTARSIADALLSIAIHRKTEEMQTLLTAEGSAEGDARLDLQRKMHAVATVIEELRKRRYSPSSNSTPDLKFWRGNQGNFEQLGILLGINRDRTQPGRKYDPRSSRNTGEIPRRAFGETTGAEAAAALDLPQVIFGDRIPKRFHVGALLARANDDSGEFRIIEFGLDDKRRFLFPVRIRKTFEVFQNFTESILGKH
jgi:DNA primase